MQSTMRKQIFVSMIMANAVANPATAGVLDAMLDGMYVNTTDAGAYHSQTRGGFVGGSLVARTPIRSVNVVSFDPPRFAAGCGGIDMYMGSFSFINGDQIVATLRAIGQNAKGLLFKMAIDVINNFLGGAISQFSEKMEKLNQHLKNTCAVAEYLVPNTPSQLSDWAHKKGETLATAVGKIDDPFSAVSEHFKKPDWSKAFGDPKAMSADDKQVALQNESLGNIAWRAFYTSGAGQKLGDPALPIVSFNGDNADKNIVQLLINVTGTIINSTEAAADKDKNGNTVCKDKVTCEKSVKSYYGNNLSVADLIDPGDKTIHACLTSDISAEEELGCQEMTDKKLSSFFGGTSKYVNKTLFGIDQAGAVDISSALTSGIVYKIQHGETLDNAEIKFLNNTDIPFLAYLRKVQRDPTAVRKVAFDASEIIAEDMAIRMGRAIYVAANAGWTGKEVKVVRPEFVTQYLTAFQNDLLSYDQNTKQRIATITALNSYVAGIINSLPGASFSQGSWKVGRG